VHNGCNAGFNIQKLGSHIYIPMRLALPGIILPLNLLSAGRGFFGNTEIIEGGMAAYSIYFKSTPEK
jgi:hypothetical protein